MPWEIGLAFCDTLCCHWPPDPLAFLMHSKIYSVILCEVCSTVCEHTSALAHMHTSLERSELTDVLQKTQNP